MRAPVPRSCERGDSGRDGSVGLAAQRTRLLLAMLACAIVATLGIPKSAFAEVSWWQMGSETVPTNLPPRAEGDLLIVLSNLGDAPIEGAKETVTFTDKLPSALVATAIQGEVRGHTQMECTLTTVACTFKGIVYPYEQISVAIKVRVEEPSGTVTTLPDEASVEGGGAARVSRTLAVPVNGEPAGYGLASFRMSPLNEDGTPAETAGSHPFELSTSLAFNQNAAREPVALPKDLSFRLPPGLIGNPNAVSQCTMADFFTLVKETNLCAPNTVVGVSYVTAFEPKLKLIEASAPVFNLVPAQGEPARLGFEVAGKIPVVIDTSVRSGSDYGVNATVQNATETGGILSSHLTLWGVPGDPRHNSSRGWECVDGGFYQNEINRACPATSQEPEAPFLTLPTSCAGDLQTEPVRFAMETDSWADPGSFLGDEYAWMNEEGKLLGFAECSELPFTPELDVHAEQHAAATPTGLEVKIKLPQQTTLEAGARAEADVRDTTVTLPEGVELSPSAANGLEGCSEAQVGFTRFDDATQTDQFNTARAACPNGSKLGTVRIKTPLLSHELEGAVYLATPAPNGELARNPFNSLVALYLVAEDPVSGVLVKLAGEGHLNEGSLQVSTTFKNTPQLPFEELTLELFGGPKASLSTPAVCGSYPTNAVFTPWSDDNELNVLSPDADFAVSSGAGGGACPSSGLPFAPGLAAGASDRQAGAFTRFGVELSRPDGDQALSTISMHLPPGIAAMLSSVELCPEAQATASVCPQGSLVGEATAVAGLGSEPYVQRGGKVYITGPYGGAPFGLEIVTPADAGPFNLGYVTVRSELYINPENASVTIVSDPLPTQLRGIPLQLKRVLVEVNRPEFEFNPTNCNQMQIQGTITGAEGASANVASPFRVENCAGLPFAPALSAAVTGHASKADGTSFTVKVSSKGIGQANIQKVDLQLPKQLPSRLPTIQKACLASVFEANPAACDEGSLIGTATIHTPVLKNPLTGPAYLVSHGNAAFPDVEFVLQGEGIELILDGKTQIKNGITYSKFESAPDAPFTTFETVLPAGPHSALTANVAERKHFELCGETLEMPTTIVGQNGDVIERDTRLTIEGCGAVKAVKAKKLTRAQLLARALKSCRSHYKHARHKRAACERAARRRHAARKATRYKTGAADHRRAL
jgi:hypothetical protein